MQLELLDKQICDQLQNGLTICRKPFAHIAQNLGVSEKQVLLRVDYLLEVGLIRRLSAMINYHSLGRTSTLVTAALEVHKIEQVADVISGLKNVSHNYQRDHFYNLWFTFQGQDQADINQQLKKLSSELNVDFKSLPVVRFFKLNVNFDIITNTPEKDNKANKTQQIVELTDLQKKILTNIQKGIKPTSNVFDFLSDQQIDIESVLEVLQQLKNLGVIKRIAAVFNHRLLGYNANVMFVSKVDKNKIVTAGQKLACYKQVSHCYQRKTFAGFDYNLYAMLHARDITEIKSTVKKFIESENITDYQLLTTIKEFKKKPVKYRF